MTTIYFIEARSRLTGDLYLRDDRPINWSPDIFRAKMYGSPDAAQRARDFVHGRQLAINSRTTENAQVYEVRVGSITLAERERQRQAMKDTLNRPDPARFRPDGTPKRVYRASVHNEGRRN